MSKKFNIGDRATVQLGNPSDSCGYRENVPCEVVGKRDNFGKVFYLVKILDREGQYADACVYHREVNGVLYSTYSRSIGKNYPDRVDFEDLVFQMGYNVNDLNPMDTWFNYDTPAYVFAKGWMMSKDIEFNPAWKNGTGYFDYAVKGVNAPELSAGEMRRCKDEYDRMVILIGTSAGNVVIFNRFSDWESTDNHIFAYNMPLQIEKLFQFENGVNSKEVMKMIIGTCTKENIGTRIQEFISN